MRASRNIVLEKSIPVLYLSAFKPPQAESQNLPKQRNMINTAPSVSVVVPLHNEEESVGPLVREVKDALSSFEHWELLLIDDGSKDSTPEAVQLECEHDKRVRLIRLAMNYGQTQAMQAGFDNALGEIVVSMDGDLQNDPRDIPRLIEALNNGYDLVAGYRMRRQDKLVTRKIPSFIANRLIGRITGIRIRDNGCSLKAYRRETLARMDLYSDMHRFLPALAAATARARITEIPVHHRARKFGESKYGLSRIYKVLADLLTIKMISSFRERPLAMFGTAAAVSFGAGLIFGVWSAIQILTSSSPRSDDYVLPGVSILGFALGAYLLMVGLISEVALNRLRYEGGWWRWLQRSEELI